MASREGDGRSYIVEFIVVGNSVKVCALDPQTLLEVSIVGPKNVSEKQLSRLAVQKLEYMLRKRGDGPDNRPGIKV
ncbi:MAG: hypothetical protein HOK21_20280 [Rhodospirillaceae bacterium]|jgi:hypothetical protein|nr:hypothetical protein [Rhodospirillaceae bacterium]MBT4689965.1 hypothetical protein [Rhodospirillaceae bacterium]MBT5080113.1 hypothetical protein [Rhodospirillaceae bacterium]MBT5526431.1 hypothetical protein [Rhodospirillaceae bacterium]MBT5880482.1 hypothetical protein [Rhodospirillaceae bacterium]